MNQRRHLFAFIIAAAGSLTTLALAPLAATAGITFDVAITKSHTGNFTQGQNGTFTISLHDNGPSATGSDTLTVTDALPSDLSYVSDTGSANGLPCTVNGQIVTCSGAPNSGAGISAAGDLSFTITVAVSASAPSTIQNTATFSDSFNGDTNATNNSSTDTVTVDAAPSPSPSPSASPSPSPSASPSPSPTAGVSPAASASPSASPSAATGPVALADTGGNGSGFPFGILLAAAIPLLAGAVAARRAGRRRAG